LSNHAALIRQENAGLTVSRRGRRFLEFALPDGKTKHVATIEPLHLRDSETEIDATWVTDTGAWQWKLASTDFQAHARSVFNVGNLYEWRHSSDEWVIVDPQSINWINQDNSRQQIAIKQAITGAANDATLTFQNAYGAGRHFSYTAHPKRLIKHITIDTLGDLPAPTVTGTIWFEAEFTISNSSGVELYLDGVRWARGNNVRVRTGNQIEFRNDAGDVLWYADAPIATDSDGETVSAEYEVRRQGGTYFITVRVPREWLLSAVYPVIVDPTFTDGYGGDVTTYADTCILSPLPESNNGARPDLWSQASRHVLLRFILSSIDSGATCDSATLYVTYKQPDEATYNVYQIATANGDWIEGTKNAAQAGAGEPCWEAKEADGSGGVTTAWAGSEGLSTSGTDYDASSLGSYETAEADGSLYEYSTTLTASVVEGWFGDATNNGLLVRTTDTTWTDPYIYSSDEETTGYRPKLVVVYTAAGGGVISEIATVLWANVGQFAGVAEASIAQVAGVVAN